MNQSPPPSDTGRFAARGAMSAPDAETGSASPPQAPSDTGRFRACSDRASQESVGGRCPGEEVARGPERDHDDEEGVSALDLATAVARPTHSPMTGGDNRPRKRQESQASGSGRWYLTVREPLQASVYADYAERLRGADPAEIEEALDEAITEAVFMGIRDRDAGRIRTLRRRFEANLEARGLLVAETATGYSLDVRVHGRRRRRLR